jgi:hypothetical protein
VTTRQFVQGILLLACVLMIAGTSGDPDLWGHVRFGQDMLASGAIHVPETYSFTADRPWINHEWLSEILMAGSYNALGAPGLNLLRIAVVGIVLLVIWRGLGSLTTRKQIPIIVAATLGIFLRALPIRPQVFSLAMFALLLAIIVHAGRTKSWRALALVPVVMAVWVNLHGGWIVGLGVFGLWSLMTMPARPWADRLVLAGAVAASLAATLVNPYGVEMWQFLATTVRMERPMIADWQPLYTLPYGFWIAWIATFAVVAVAVTRGRSQVDPRYVAITALLGAAAVRVSRLDAFFAIAATMLLAPALARPSTAEPEPEAPQRRSLVLGGAFVLCLLGAAVIVMPRVLAIPVAPGTTPDAEVAEYVRGHGVSGKMVTWFNWGQYTIWHFGNHVKVSMDGRRETVYSDAVVAAHMRFYRGAPGAWRYADEVGADYIWLPSDLPVTRELQLQGWRTLCQGPSSVLLTRRHLATPCVTGGQRKSTSFPAL